MQITNPFARTALADAVTAAVGVLIADHARAEQVSQLIVDRIDEQMMHAFFGSTTPLQYKATTPVTYEDILEAAEILARDRLEERATGCNRAWSIARQPGLATLRNTTA